MGIQTDLTKAKHRIAAMMFIALGLFAAFSLSCRAQPPEEAALDSLRRMTRTGILPAESVVADIEGRYAGTSTGALARLLRARIRIENGNPAGAAELLDSEIFAEKTGLGDYALWLRGTAYLLADNDVQAEKVFEDLFKRYPGSLRVKDARLLWAERLNKKGLGQKMITVLQPLIDADNPAALLAAARGYDKSSNPENAARLYRRIYFYAAGSEESAEAEKWFADSQQTLKPETAEDIVTRANSLFRRGSFKSAAAAYEEAIRIYPGKVSPVMLLNRFKAYAGARQGEQAKTAYLAIDLSMQEKEEAYYQMAIALARDRAWDQVRVHVDEMQRNLPKSKWTPKTLIDTGMIARDQRRKPEESYFLNTAVNSYSDAVDVTAAQFELAWLEHENKNYRESAKMLTEHIARYVDKDNSYRGKSGYWAARDSERAGMLEEACALYDAVVYRYGSNWYGYLGLDRLLTLKRNGQCQKPKTWPVGSLIPKAVANMKVITVAAETSTPRDVARAEKSEELSVIGLFDWAIEELEAAQKNAGNSPRINLALAKHYRLKGDNVKALLALAKSYPDYSQMFPEEMGRDEWDIFYPLVNWNDVKYWAGQRRLDPYQVAGLIRQETIFNPTAKSSANAYGLMQLLIPTARMMARKYSSTDSSSISGTTLFNPRLNIELGTAYMREQLDRYGRIEYMSVAYNAGPGRVVRWRRDLPSEIDEFVEEIPFTETRGYVQGVIRNSAQYRRLYDVDGKFKPNVGTKPLRGAIDSKPAAQFAKENPGVLVERERKSAK